LILILIHINNPHIINIWRSVWVINDIISINPLPITIIDTHDVLIIIIVFQLLLKHDIVSGSSVLRFDLGDVFKPLITFTDVHGMVYTHIE